MSIRQLGHLERLKIDASRISGKRREWNQWLLSTPGQIGSDIAEDRFYKLAFLPDLKHSSKQ